MKESLAEHYLENVSERLRALKELAERAFAQVSDEEFFRTIDAESNSIAALLKHLGGNMLSRWTDFLTTDGEKPGRSRDAEFSVRGEDRAAVLALWEAGWERLLAAVGGLAPEDLLRTVTIRGEPHTVVAAINRQLSHYASHVGQIVFLAKHFKSGAWQTLSIPRGRSAAFNEELRKKREG